MIKQLSKLEPTVLTIFGATGDLSANYLLPALWRMALDKLLPQNFRLVAVGRRDFDTAGYLDFISKKSRHLKLLGREARKKIFKNLVYYRGDLDNPSSFSGLADLLQDPKSSNYACFNRLYYFATAPEFFPKITSILNNAGLLKACAGHNRQVRVLIEKPFGSDLKTAKVLNRTLLKYFSEEQIYRIDHYQGKETVQNLMVVRFANSLFEPLWNKNFISHIEVSVLYDDRVGERAYFDQAGILRDAVQNHALQMLAMILMDEPRELLTKYICDEKVKILEALRPFKKYGAKDSVLRGQYLGYTKEVGRTSHSETYAALKAFVDSPRWKGVPIYIRAGLALRKKIIEISIHFKDLPRCLFRGCAANVMTFRIQPDESVRLRINNKVPGFGINLHQADWEFSYQAAFQNRIAGAYERLILDFIEGDQRLFIRSDEIEAAWEFIDSVRDTWSGLPLLKYQPGSRGPKEADKFVAKDGHEWWTK